MAALFCGPRIALGHMNIEREETWSAFWSICVDCFGLRLGVVEVDWSKCRYMFSLFYETAR